jgi:hypothetical protein
LQLLTNADTYKAGKFSYEEHFICTSLMNQAAYTWQLRFTLKYINLIK